MKIASWLCKLLLLSLIFISPTQELLAQPRSEAPLHVLRITPTGDDATTERQIVIEFDRPVVPLGRMERSAKEVPVTIRPELDCEWRWISTSALACQLGENAAMLRATRYQLTIPGGGAGFDGQPLAAHLEHSFVTQRPKVSNEWFDRWEAPGIAKFTVAFDQPVTEDSVRAHLYFLSEPGRIRTRVEIKRPEHTTEPRFWVQPATPLPPDAPTELRIEPGLIPEAGGEPSVQDAALATFRTIPEFRFVELVCSSIENSEPIAIPATSLTQTGTSSGKCDPMARIALRFASPIMKEALRDNLVITPSLRGADPEFDPWAEVYSYSHLEYPYSPETDYTIALPFGLKAAATYTISAAAGSLKDEFGRSLPEALTLSFNTDHRKPRLVLDHSISTLESGVDSHLPLITTNLDSVVASYDIVRRSQTLRSRTTTLKPYDVQDIAFPFPLKIRDYLGASSGVVTGHLTSDPPTGRNPDWFFSQVTPFSVHVKLGHFNSLVWVTRFSDGTPVSGANVSAVIGSLKPFRSGSTLATAITDSSGVATLPGSSTLDPELKLLNQYNLANESLVIRVDDGVDVGFAPAIYPFQVYSDIWAQSNRRFGHLAAWGATAQGIYRAGDELQYKIYVRDHNNEHFVPAPKESYTLKLFDPLDKVVYEQSKLSLSEFGTLSGTYSIPKFAVMGWYRFELGSSFTVEKWEPLRVLITDFTPAPFKLTAEITAPFVREGDTTTVSTQARLHAGGPYASAPIRTTALIVRGALEPVDPAFADFSFNSLADLDGWANESRVYEAGSELSAAGDHEVSINVVANSSIVYGKLQVESAVQDDRGKSVATVATRPYAARDRYVGLKQRQWMVRQGEPYSIDSVVVDELGKTQAGTKIEIIAERNEVTASRVKTSGNFYDTVYNEQWIVDGTCSIVSTDAAVPCALTPSKPGAYRIKATILDNNERAHSSALYTWATGSGNVLWESSPTTRLTIIPEKKRFQTGDTARFMVQNPFGKAQAMITLERYGVLKQWTEDFSESVEIIEVPITPDQVPGFFLSVVLVSPRVDQPLDEAGIDLGKPSFRLGYQQVDIQDRAKELLISATPERETYKPRERVRVALNVRSPQALGATRPEPTELAVTVLDEAVFDLIQGGDVAFDPYRGFYKLGSLDVFNFNLLQKLVGRQKFEKKGANPGGDGGSDQDLRSLFKFVSYWNASILPDRDGNAVIEFDAPDNLTAWKVLVLGATKTDQLGLGSGRFVVNKPIEIRPALPNLLRSGDQTTARFTVLNRTETAKTLRVLASARGAVTDGAERVIESTVVAEPFKRVEVALPITAASVPAAGGSITLRVSAGDDQVSDSIELSVPVQATLTLQTASTFATTTSDSSSEQIVLPQDIFSDVGSLSVNISPSLLGNFEAIFDFARAYPYSCWEQKLTKGALAAFHNSLKAYLPKQFSWEAAAGLPERTVAELSSFQAPNGGMCFYQATNETVSPYLSAYTAIALQWLVENGVAVPKEPQARLHQYLQRALKENIFPSHYSERMTLATRAAILSALSRTGSIDAAEVLRLQGQYSLMNLFGKSLYLEALHQIAPTSPQARLLAGRVLNQILSAADESSGKLVFVEPLDMLDQQVLDSQTRSQCAVLSALLSHDRAKAEGHETIGLRVAKLAQAIDRTRSGKEHWLNTQENMFCLRALAEYSRQYEKDPVSMTLAVNLAGKQMGAGRLDSLTDQPVIAEQPLTSEFIAAATGAQELRVERTGTGRWYQTTRLRFSPKNPGQQSINSGIEVRREYSVERNGTWQLLRSPFVVRRGELVKVSLFLSIPAARHFIVVSDAVPGGLEPVNRDLATSSRVDADKGDGAVAVGSFWYSSQDWNYFSEFTRGFYHREMGHAAVRFYSEYLDGGNYSLSYVAQAIAPGEFTVLPLHAEEMYDPEVFGTWVSERLSVVED